jgi:(p)ppGpp synthase/HD superfamily hydrolase
MPDRELTLKDVEGAGIDVIIYHGGRFRRSGLPGYTHLFAVAETLFKYGHDDYHTLCAGLLHDSIEVLRENEELIETRRQEIGENYNWELSNDLWILSRNRGKGGKKIPDEEYNDGILQAKVEVQRVKIADINDVLRDPENLVSLAKARKVTEATEIYIPLGEEIAPLMVKELVTNVENCLTNMD